MNDNAGNPSMRAALAMIALTGCLGLGAVQAEAGSQDEGGRQVFERACATCHAESMSPAETERAEDMLAPPMNLLTTIIRKKTGNSEQAFVDHVVDFTFDPARGKVKAMREALQRFGLMPPIRTLHPEMTRAEVAAAARWLFARYDYDRELRALKQHQRHEADH
jgi:cytochrome c5